MGLCSSDKTKNMVSPWLGFNIALQQHLQIQYLFCKSSERIVTSIIQIISGNGWTGYRIGRVTFTSTPNDVFWSIMLGECGHLSCGWWIKVLRLLIEYEDVVGRSVGWASVIVQKSRCLPVCGFYRVEISSSTGDVSCGGGSSMQERRRHLTVILK